MRLYLALSRQHAIAVSAYNNMFFVVCEVCLFYKIKIKKQVSTVIEKINQWIPVYSNNLFSFHETVPLEILKVIGSLHMESNYTY